jgi:hypothetical protein
MQTPFPPFAALALHRGYNQNLQLIGIGTDGLLYRPAWQPHASSGNTWTIETANALAFQQGTFTAIAMGYGNGDNLWVIGLGEDRHIYLAARQSSSSDSWFPPAPAFSGPMGDPERRHEAVAAHRGGNGRLQILGLGTDGQIYVVAQQDEHDNWQADGRRLANPGTHYSAVLAVAGNSDILQVLGLGSDGRAYLAAWQDGKGWHDDGRMVGNPKHSYAALAAGKSRKGHLEVLGLGTDRKAYLAAWQDDGGGWHVSEKYGGPLGNESRPYVAVAANIGADLNFQAVCLGADGKVYLAAYQDKNGDWHAPWPKSNGPLGDPLTTYRALVVASGNEAGKGRPGNLIVAGLGAGENDDGLAYAATWQDRDHGWHSSEALGKIRSPIVNWENPTGQKVDGGCVAFGRLWVAQGSSVKSFDVISGVPGRKLSPFGANASPRFIQPYGDRLAIACDDGRVYAADPDTGAISAVAYTGIPSWMAAYQGALFVAGDGVVRIGPDEAVSRPYGRDVLGGSPAVAGGVVYVPIHSSGLGSSVDAVDADTMSLLWSAAADGRPGPAFCDGSQLCFTTSGRSLFVYDVGSRAPVTPEGRPIRLAEETGIQPVINSKLCYVAIGGAVQALDVATGEVRQSFAPVRDPVGDPVMSEGGVLFYGSSGSVSVIDTALESGNVPTRQTGAWPFLAAHQDGALFFADSGSAAAVRLDEAIHQYYAETSLIQDFDFSNGVGAATSAPNFQVEVALFETDGSPRAGQPVRLAATVPTTLAYQGRTMRISTTEFVDVETDGAGRFRVAVAAGATDRSGRFHQGLTAPELLLTSPFMDRRMRFVIRPHGKLQQQLATIKKEKLKGAKGYDGQDVLTSEYREDDTRLTAATGAINQTSGMVRASMAEPRKRDAGNRYCDSACDMAVACCMPAGDPDGRLVCEQSFCFDLTAGRANFRLLSVAEAEAAAAALTGPQGGWDDFWDDVKSGVAKVTGAVITAVANGADVTITFVKGAATAVVRGVISAIEQATLLVQGIFNEIATAIHRVVEAVSFVFDWDEIVWLHEQIRDQVSSAWTSLLTGAHGVSLDAIRQQLDGWFETGKSSVNRALDDVKTKLGVQTPLGAGAEASHKPNGAIGTAQDNWLLAKVQSNIVVSEMSTGAAAPAINWPELDFGEEVKRAFDSFGTDLNTSLKAEFLATIARVQEDLRSGPGLAARGFAAVIDILRGLVDIAFDIGQAATDRLIDLLKAMMSVAMKFVTTEISIPYVSDLYEWATGSKLTLLDLLALLAAIPAGFAMGRICRDPAYASGVSPAPPTARAVRGGGDHARPPLPAGWLTIVAGCGQVVWGVASGVMGLFNLYQINKSGPPEPWSRPSRLAVARAAITFTALVAVRGFFLAAILAPIIEGKTSFDWLVFVIWLVPTIVMGMDVLSILAGSLTIRGTTFDIMPWITAAYSAAAGLVLWGFAAALFIVGRMETGDLLALLFSGSVGFAFASRLLLPFKDFRIRIVGIGAGAALIGVSGAFEIARGALAVGSRPTAAPAASP